MPDGDFATLVSATRDSNSTSNPLFVRITDGTDLVNIDGSGNLNVILAANDGVDIGDVDVTSVIPGVGATNLGKAEDAVHVSGDTGVMFLVIRQDSQVDFGADGDYVPLSVDANGELRVTAGTDAANKVDDAAFTVAVDTVKVAGYLADETSPDSVDEGDVGAARMTLDRKQLHVLVDATVDSQRLAIDASGLAQIDIAAISVAALPVSATTAVNTEINPLFVQVVNGATSGNEVHDYDTAAAVAGDATDNHDYTVVNATFLLKEVIMSSSGGSKFEIQTGPLASLVTVAVGFIPKEGGTQTIKFDPSKEVPVASTGTVRVIRTNRQGQAQDLYSTIVGNDI